jgi:hypothetical protein
MVSSSSMARLWGGLMAARHGYRLLAARRLDYIFCRNKYIKIHAVVAFLGKGGLPRSSLAIDNPKAGWALYGPGQAAFR